MTQPVSRPPLRVLMNALHAKSGGGVTYLQNMLPLLADDPELELHLFIDVDQFALFDPVDERIRLHLFSFGQGLAGLLLWEQLCLPYLARVMKADVIFSPANFGPVLSRQTIILLRNSLAVAGRETRITRRIYWAGLAGMTFLSLITCRRAIAVSEYACQVLTFGLRRRLQNRLRVIYHGVATHYLASTALNRRGGPEESGAFLLVVADIYVQKNLHVLLESFSMLRPLFPRLTLKVAGRKIDVDYFDELQRQIRRLSIEDSVTFLGSVPAQQLRDLYERCVVFVFPSTVETFGNPLVEAMACGAPVACSNTAAIPEIAGEAAEYFDPLSAESLKQAIERLLRDSELRSELTGKARRRAARFSWSRTAAATSEVIKDSRRRHADARQADR